MSYLNAGIEICANGEMIIRHGNSCITMGMTSVENCGTAFGIGDIPRAKIRDDFGVVKKLIIAMNVNRIKSLPLVDYTGTKWGWQNYDLLIDNHYFAVGREYEGKVYSITGEFIGMQFQIKQAIMVLSHKNEYENMEPIWTHPVDTNTFNIKSYKGFDLSHRLRSSSR